MIGAALAAVSSSRAESTIHWQTLGNHAEGERIVNIQRLSLHTGEGIERILFNCFARNWTPLNPLDTVGEIIPGYYYIASPRLMVPNTDIDIDLRSNWAVTLHMEVPDGFHALLPDGTTEKMRLVRTPLSDNPAILSAGAWHRDFLQADSVYRLNDIISRGASPSAYDIVPSFKSVTATSDKGVFRKGDPVIKKIRKNKNPEYFKITVSDGKAVVEAPNILSADRAERILYRVLLPINGDSLPAAVIEDWPDFPYRGFMLDFVRNKMNLQDIYRVTELMADLRMNKLHFHFSDDEAWRLEIPGLPELTEYGSRRGYTLDENDFLAQIYDGDGNPDNPDKNGYISRQQMIDFLRHCRKLGIDVIPEIESPGHARAAVKAMEKRYRDSGDDAYRLIEDGDTSIYTTAQDYHDNLMNPALPGTYRFMEKVVDEIASMYADAGVPLAGIHIGGDEVPEGAWDGSPAVRKMMEQKGLKSKMEVQGEFVVRMADILSRRNIPMYGWQDICAGFTDSMNRKQTPAVAGINCWTQSGGKEGISDKGVRNGYPVIISNVDYFYLDQTYQSHPDEPGMTWGGIVDEFRTLHGIPSELCPAIEEGPGKVIGVSGHFFSETMRDFGMVEKYLLPRILGIAERGWNGSPTYSDADWNILIGERFLPWLSLQGYDFHLRQPAIKIEDGKILMNSPYSHAEIRYTLDGTSPSTESPLYVDPIPYTEGLKPRAMLIYLEKKSLPTMAF